MATGTRLLAAALFCASCTLSARATSVNGRVTDLATSAPVAAAAVEISESDPLPFNASVTTGNDGTYQLDVPQGLANIVVTAAGHLRFTDSFDVGSAPAIYDVALLPYSGISGTVRTRDGNPVAAKRVDVFDAASGMLRSWTTSATDGSYSVGGLLGDFGVCVIDPNDAVVDSCYDDIVQSSGTPAFTSVHVALGQVVGGIDFALSFGTSLQGRLHDSYFNVPIADADIAIEVYSTQRSRLASIAVHTDFNGDYQVSGLAPGSYYLSAGDYWWPGWRANAVYTPRLFGGGECSDMIGLVPQQCPFDGVSLLLVAAAPVTGVDFDLFPGHVVSGRVTDATSGSGLPNVTVASCDDTSFVFSATSGQTLTDSNGNYIVGHAAGNGTKIMAGAVPGYLNQIWPGAATSSANCLEPVAGQILSFGAPDTELAAIDFALHRAATISGTVTAAEFATPLPQQSLLLYKNEDTAIRFLATLYSAPDGTFQIAQLPAGSYYLVAYNDADCQAYDHAACGANWSANYPTQVDLGAASSITVQEGDLRTGIALELRDRVFAGGFE